MPLPLCSSFIGIEPETPHRDHQRQRRRPHPPHPPQSGIPATLYEREPSFASRRHLGGSLDLGYDTGLRALSENDLEQQFKRHSCPEGDGSRYCDSARVLSTSIADPNGDPRALHPEIDRSALRKSMLDAIPPDVIKWGHAFSVRALGDGEHELTFANGQTTVSDIFDARDNEGNCERVGRGTT